MSYKHNKPKRLKKLYIQVGTFLQQQIFSWFFFFFFGLVKRLSKISVIFKTHNHDNSESSKKLILNIIKVPCDTYRSQSVINIQNISAPKSWWFKTRPGDLVMPDPFDWFCRQKLHKNRLHYTILYHLGPFGTF